MATQSDKAAVLHWLYRAHLPETTFTFDDLLIDAVQEVLSLSRSDAEQHVEARCAHYWNALSKVLDADQMRGLAPLVRIEDSTSRRVRAYHAWLRAGKLRSHRFRAVALAARPDLLAAIDALDDREFESLGCVVSRLIGAPNVHLTTKGKEAGIDFFAQIQVVNGRSHLFGDATGPLRIIAQCKKQGRRLEGAEMTKLVQVIQEVMHRDPTVERLVPPWFRTSRGPIVGWMLSANGFQSEALNKAKHFGIVCSDSNDLAYALALSRGLAPYDPPSERVALLRQKVADLLMESK